MCTVPITIAIVQAVFSLDYARIREEMLWRTFLAVAQVESGGDPRAVNLKEGAVGLIQIRRIMLKDANRVLGHEKYTLDDRLNPRKCWEIWRLICRYYENQGGPEEWSRLWNAGPDWRKNRHVSDRYWAKVKQALSR